MNVGDRVVYTAVPGSPGAVREIKFYVSQADITGGPGSIGTNNPNDPATARLEITGDSSPVNFIDGGFQGPFQLRIVDSGDASTDPNDGKHGTVVLVQNEGNIRVMFDDGTFSYVTPDTLSLE